MDKTNLVGADLQAGRWLIEKLESLGITVDVAAWLKDDETGAWKLVLSSPELVRSPSRRMYDAVVSILHNPGDADLDLDDVQILSPTDGIIKDLKDRIRTNDELQDIRLENPYLGDQPFRGARIYRVIGGRNRRQKLEFGARVRVKATGQPGFVQGIVRTSNGPRYLVLYDVKTDNGQPLSEKPPPPVGQNYAADDLDLVYAFRTLGWPDSNPDWLIEATSAGGMDMRALDRAANGKALHRASAQRHAK